MTCEDIYGRNGNLGWRDFRSRPAPRVWPKSHLAADHPGLQLSFAGTVEDDDDEGHAMQSDAAALRTKTGFLVAPNQKCETKSLATTGNLHAQFHAQF